MGVEDNKNLDEVKNVEEVKDVEEVGEPVDEGMHIEMSKDKMLGVVWFDEPKNGGAQLTSHEIGERIGAKGISSGINQEIYKEILDKRNYGFKYIVARGKEAKDGEDGRIEFAFDVKSLKAFKPKLNEDGTVDLKDLSAVFNVKKGDVLAKKILATDGEEGYNVMGQKLKAKKGKDARMPKGKNTAVLEDNVTLVADIDGKLEYDDHNVYINSVYNIMGDLDSSIGNVDFIGNVVIGGSIHSGFTVKAGGSVEVRGPVDEAIIIAGGDVLLGYGIQGNEKSKITAGGNVVAKFIQNTVVEADKSVIAEAILHSTITAGESIKVDNGKGIIVGGSVAATDMIMARTIGSPMGTVTAVQIGVAPTAYQDYKQMGEELRVMTKNIEKIDQGIRFLVEKSKGVQLDPQKKMMLHKFNATRQPIVDEYTQLKQKYTQLGNRLNNVHNGLIKVTDTIFPGVRITWGNIIKYIDEEQVHCTVRKEEGEIYIGV